MVRTLRIVLFAVLAAACFAPAASAAPRDARLAGAKSWAFAIGSEKIVNSLPGRPEHFDLVVVDGEGTSSAQVQRLKSTGAIVLAYLSAGSIERGRSWYRRAKPYRLDFWGEWGEWYADVSKARFRDLLVQSVAPKILSKGFDGLFLDNVDMIETHRKQTRGMHKLVKRLARLAHVRGGFAFAQNGASVIDPMLGYLDGWNREDVGFTYEFENHAYARLPKDDIVLAQDELRRIGAKGLLTTATSYTDGKNPSQTSAAIDFACAAGALPFVTNIGLTRVGAPETCR